MSALPTRLSVNLLTQDSFSASIVGKILLWALSVGRYIVVFTELIVILSFLSRFKLDRDLTDLNSDIARQTAIIESYGDLEEKVRQIQQQLETVRQKQTSTSAMTYLELLEKITPVGIRLEQLTIKPNILQLIAHADNPTALENFIALMSTDKTLSNIQLTSITNSPDGSGISAEIKADVGARAPAKKPAASPKPSQNNGPEDI